MTEKPNIRISPITEDALPNVADIHREAFAGYMSSRIGKDYVIAVLRWFILQEDTIALMSLSENDGLCGYVVGAPLGYEKRMNKEVFGVAAKGMITHPWLLFDKQIRRTVVRKVKLLLGQSIPAQQVPDLPEPIISLVGIGTTVKMRGRGAGKMLMSAFEEESRKKKIASMRLSVYPNNITARKLYEKFGWQPFIEPSTEGIAMYYSKVL
jgi:ribosomal protein S18 acetylase RimI-like enzyme